MIEQHGETYADGLIAIVEQFEDSAASTAGGGGTRLEAVPKDVEAI